MHWFLILWLIGLGLVLALAALRAGAFDLAITLPVDLDLLLVATSLILVVAGILAMSFKRTMDHLRQLSVEKARDEAFAEHRRFLIRLDHELKNPLTAILAGIVSLRESGIPPEQRQVIASMESQTLRLSRLVTDLRKLAEIETVPLDEERIDLRDLLAEIVDMVEERAADGDRELVLNLPTGHQPLPWIHGDRDLLFLALHNLVDNAFKFTCPGDTIEIRTRVEEAEVRIEIRDTGLGIIEREVPLVWQELYRGKGAVGTLGSGVGLALVQAIVKRSAGTIEMESQVDQGTTVTLRFPLAAALD